MERGVQQKAAAGRRSSLIFIGLIGEGSEEGFLRSRYASSPETNDDIS
jgi:hypothetical protein